MVKLGELFWLAEVRGGSEAADTAGQLQDNMEGVAESAAGAVAAQNQYGSETQEATERTEEANRWTGKLDTSTGLLGSALFFTADMFGVAGVATTAYTGAVKAGTFATTVLTGAVKAGRLALLGFSKAAGLAWASLAGPAGLAAGLFLAVAGAGVLGSELLGLTDATGIAQAEADSMAGAFADMAFLIGGPLAGFLSAGFSLVTGDFEAAKNKFVNTSVEWTKAAARFAARTKAGLQSLGVATFTGLSAAVEAADFAWRAGWNEISRFTTRQINGIVEQVARVNNLPGVNLDLGGRVGLPTVENESLSSRISRVSRRGRGMIERIQRVQGRNLERFAPDTIGGSRRTRGIQDPSPNVGEQNVTVNIDASGANFEDMNGAERREFASMVGDEVGSSTGNKAGGK